MDKLWLSPEILEWNNFISFDYTDWASDQAKPYRILEHAKQKLDVIDEHLDTENFNLGDAIVNMKQAIEHRENQMKERYDFFNLEFIQTQKVYKQLQYLGITKPVLLQNLSSIRNIVMHQQKYPANQDKKELEKLWEFAWYFLRATDVFIARVIDGMLLSPPEKESIPEIVYNEVGSIEDFEAGCLYLHSFETNWEIRIEGKELPLSLFSFEEKTGWIEIDDAEISGWPQEEIVRLVFGGGTSEEIEKCESETRRKYLQDGKPINLERGKIVGPIDKTETIVRRYLAMYIFH